MAFAGVASGLHLAALRPTALPSSLTARHRRCGTGMRALEPLMATTTKASLTVVASKQSRYLRDAAQATEALVLATYYAGQPDQIWTPSTPNKLKMNVRNMTTVASCGNDFSNADTNSFKPATNTTAQWMVRTRTSHCQQH